MTDKEKLDVVYTLFGVAADVCQLARSYLRSEPQGVKNNISQIITKLEQISKSI